MGGVAMTDAIAPPILFRWDGSGMVPLPGRYAEEADRYFVIGRVYRMTEWLDRSDKSHKHEFAELREAFRNLPEHWARLFRTEDELRKYALCKAGFVDVKKTIVCPSKAFAADLYRQLAGDFDYAVIDGNAVILMKAESQKRHRTVRKRFQEQKSGVLAVLEDMLGLEPGALSRNAGRAA
jgi:hypothetical protein